MNIDKYLIREFKTYITYDSGYRIVYFYEKYHEVKMGLHVDNIDNFKSLVNAKNINEVLNKYLELNELALGVAIYDVKGNCIKKKIKSGVKKINNTEVFIEELKYDYNYTNKTNGYRIVYFYEDDSYKFGSYAGEIEGFMYDFVECDPIMDESDVPKFISIDDLLNRYLNDLPNIVAVAIYDFDGKCISKMKR